ncbi:hypothetical protein F5X98DRAFT_376784 [Xylaria grammica]|nr:hypothetical protein F5X98DRAFT_376784 [Xylaria grammica]
MSKLPELQMQAEYLKEAGISLGEFDTPEVSFKMLGKRILSARRPVLISIITGGLPEKESLDTLKKAMIQCGDTLETHGHHKAVRFQLSQIGHHKDAKKFLASLRTEPFLKDVLFCIAEQLETKFEELRDNGRRLEQWVLKLLMGPIMDAEEY